MDTKGKNKLKTAGVVVSTVADTNTGEVLGVDVKRHTYLSDTKEEFFLMYVTAISLIISLQPTSKSVYAYILGEYSNGTGFTVGGYLRGLIAESIGCSKSAVANAFTELKDKGLLYSPVRGFYVVNPRYAFKGRHAERNKRLKAVIELGIKSGVDL